MQARNQRPHFIRSGQRQPNKNERTKCKMLTLLLRRVCNHKLNDYFQSIRKFGNNNYCILEKALKRVNRNVQFVRLSAWKKLFFYSALKKKELALIRVLSVIADKYTASTKATIFSKIRVYGNRRHRTANKKLSSAKQKILSNILSKVRRRILAQSVATVRIWSQKQKLKAQKYKYLAKMMEVLTKKSTFYAWSRILSVGNSEHKDIEHQLGQLNQEMDFMRREMARKNRQIQTLKIEVSEKQIENHVNAYRQHRPKRMSSLENSRKSIKSIASGGSGNGSRRNSSQDLSEKRSEAVNSENANNTSILSWLNGSFMSIKSGKSSMSRSITGLDCYCKYRDKYNQYKAETTSLKNQLQIIKSELQVTKDLNQHLQSQISNLCFNTEESPELELLRKEVKDLRRDKEVMKQKMIRNQKYIATLKVEFKTKVQNLYRNLKKN